MRGQPVRNSKEIKTKCDMCDQSFNSISATIRHKFKVHPNSPIKFYCPYCGQQFPLKVYSSAMSFRLSHFYSHFLSHFHIISYYFILLIYFLRLIGTNIRNHMMHPRVRKKSNIRNAKSVTRRFTMERP